MRSLYFTERILSHIHIPIRRIVQHLTGFREPGAVASTVPAMLLPVVFQRTAQVGTSPCCGDQEIRSCFGAIEEQLGLQDASGRTENPGILIWLLLNQVGQGHCADH